MGMLKVVGVEKSYPRNGTQSKMVPIGLDYDGYINLYYCIIDHLLFRFLSR